MTQSTYLPPGLPAPAISPDGLDKPFWEGTRRGQLLVQRCGNCGVWQWGPEWICHHCNSFDMRWQEVDGKGVIYSWERPHHPVHPVLSGFGPYIVVMVELPAAGGIRMVGNLLGPADQEVIIGSQVEAIFEHHNDIDTPFTLIQWRRVP